MMIVLDKIVSKKQIEKYLKEGVRVCAIEPFFTFHQKGILALFPHSFPQYMYDLAEEGKIRMIKAQEIHARDIYVIASNKAVEVVENVYPEYRRENQRLVAYVSRTLRSSKAEEVFKMNLAEKLAEFYSVNIMLERVCGILGQEDFIFYPNIHVPSYLRIQALLDKSGEEYFDHKKMSFSQKDILKSILLDVKRSAATMARLLAQTVASGILGKSPKVSREKKRYLYGFGISAPARQLRGNNRGPDFLVDDKKIFAKDVVYLPLRKLKEEQKAKVEKLPGSAHYPPAAGRFFSNFKEWFALLSAALRTNFIKNWNEIHIATITLFSYFRWVTALKEIHFENFISHCDFGLWHVGRNIAFHQNGIKTWYFADAMNYGCNMQKELEICKTKHPYWCYFSYDNYVTWSEMMAQFYQKHPNSFKEMYVVGCLWSSHVEAVGEAEERVNQFVSDEHKDKFVIAAFDTTYSNNGITSYPEGLAFAEHLSKLADELPDVLIILKEKVYRHFHEKFDSIYGPQLLRAYEKMDQHPRIKILKNELLASDVMSYCDLVVSFPFTSTTFEALSVNKAAVWHDPFGYYKNTVYGKVEGVVTQGYEGLKNKILELKSSTGSHENPLPPNSPLMDPYRDGQAIERFKDLLLHGRMIKKTESISKKDRSLNTGVCDDLKRKVEK